MNNKEILFLSPVFKEMIWGGNKLKSDWGYEIPSDNTGECWAVSAHPNGDCRVINGELKGEQLSNIWANYPELFNNSDGNGNTLRDRFPLLVKIIDAKDNLSIQVHPDDAYAGKNENGSLGKTECWYVLDAPEDAKLVIGHNAKSREELISMINEGRWDEFIRYISVKAGDFIQINPGTVHAITGGLQILETQQNSDITYRVYDYDRETDGKKRELHIEKSIDVIEVPSKGVEDSVKAARDLPKDCFNELIACDYYRVFKADIESEINFDMDKDFMIVSVLSGEGEINGVKIEKKDHFILPYCFGKVCIKGRLTIIASSI